jgi:MscS family membrane protein
MDFIVEMIEKESYWLMQILLVIVVFFLVRFGSKQVLKRLQQKFKGSEAHWKHSLVEAIYPPVLAFIWIIAITIITNLILVRLNPESPQAFLNQVYRLTILCCLTWFFLRWTAKMELALLKEQKLHGHVIGKSKVDVIAKIIFLLIWSISILFGLEILGFNIATLVTIGGISGFSLGFASKDVISNFFGGLMLYITRPFMVGDYILAPERKIEGFVEHISWYYTLIRDNDKRPNYVPNSLFSTIVLVNNSRRTHWTFDETISIRYNDIQALHHIIEEIRAFFKTSPLFDQTLPIRVHLEHFADSALNISILACTFATDVDAVAEIRQQCLVKIAQIIQKYGASFAYPTTTLEVPGGITLHSAPAK